MTGQRNDIKIQFRKLYSHSNCPAARWRSSSAHSQYSLYHTKGPIHCYYSLKPHQTNNLKVNEKLAVVAAAVASVVAHQATTSLGAAAAPDSTAQHIWGELFGIDPLRIITYVGRFYGIK